jgi:hypothetical protein
MSTLSFAAFPPSFALTTEVLLALDHHLLSRGSAQHGRVHVQVDCSSMVLDEFRRDTPFHCRIYCLLFIDFALILWVRLVICNLRPGKQRLLAAAPVLATTCMLPFFFSDDSEIVTTVAVAFVHVWVREMLHAPKTMWRMWPSALRW